MIGHNTFASDQLKSVIERIENLNAQKWELSEDIRGVFAEAKGNGFDVPALRAIIKMRKEDADKRANREAFVETYMHSLGMLADLPLGAAAKTRMEKELAA